MSKSEYNPEIHNRKSIRLKGHDYAGGGLYFVTICAHRDAGDMFWDRRKAGISLENGATCVSPVRIIAEEWRKSGEIRDDVFPGEFVVMPDHFHGLIRIVRGESSLGNVIGAFKAAVSRRICRRGDSQVALPQDTRIWHRNYYEMIVRDAEAERNIANYIRMNPWKLMVNGSYEGGRFRAIGNPNLLNLPKMGVLCSRRVPQGVELEPPEFDGVFMSGFHSPPEREVLNRLLADGARIICCPSWGIKKMHIPKEWLPALEGNRMMIMEMTNREGNLAASEERNRFVLQLSDQQWIPHVSSGGMLERLIEDMTIALK